MWKGNSKSNQWLFSINCFNFNNFKLRINSLYFSCLWADSLAAAILNAQCRSFSFLNIVLWRIKINFNFVVWQFSLISSRKIAIYFMSECSLVILLNESKHLSWLLIICYSSDQVSIYLNRLGIWQHKLSLTLSWQWYFWLAGVAENKIEILKKFFGLGYGGYPCDQIYIMFEPKQTFILELWGFKNAGVLHNPSSKLGLIG